MSKFCLFISHRFVTSTLVGALVVAPASLCQTGTRVKGGPAASFSSSPFSDQQAALPPKYLGNNAISIYTSLLRHEALFSKSEFETQAGYDQRMIELLARPIADGMKPGDKFAFEITPKVSYDAEEQIVTVLLSEDDTSYFDSGKRTYEWSNSSRIGRSYVGSNAFGVKRQIKTVTTSKYNLEFEPPEWFTQAYTKKENYSTIAGFKFAKSAEKALFLSITLRALVIGSLAPPFVSHEAYAGEPTVTNPIDRTTFIKALALKPSAIWLFDVLTGEVVAKFGESSGTGLRHVILQVPADGSMLRTKAPLRISSGVMMANLISKKEAIYPPIAAAAHMIGSVSLHVVVSTEGKVEKVEATSGPEMLKGSAMDAVREWVFLPYVVDGKEVEVDTTVIISFPGSGYTP